MYVSDLCILGGMDFQIYQQSLYLFREDQAFRGLKNLMSTDRNRIKAAQRKQHQIEPWNEKENK